MKPGPEPVKVALDPVRSVGVTVRDGETKARVSDLRLVLAVEDWKDYDREGGWPSEVAWDQGWDKTRVVVPGLRPGTWTLHALAVPREPDHAFWERRHGVEDARVIVALVDSEARHERDAETRRR